jgi:hypothetical protein
MLKIMSNRIERFALRIMAVTVVGSCEGGKGTAGFVKVESFSTSHTVRISRGNMFYLVS